MRELWRKLFHMTFGTLIALGVYLLGRNDGLTALFFVLLAGLVLIQWKLSGFEERITDYFLRKMERKVSVPGMGALMFVVGAILALAFSKNADWAVAVMLMFALGDGASTLIGRQGNMRIRYHKRKTWEGTVAFAVAAFVGAYLIIGWKAAPLAILLAIVESLPLPFDDNLTIPIAGAALSFLL